MKSNSKKRKWCRALLIVLIVLVLAALAAVGAYSYELSRLDNDKNVENSFYSTQFENKKVMVIVPHQDDDILIAGQVLPAMYENGADVRIVFVTNGDKHLYAHERFAETCSALSEFGIPEDKVIFLGYPDGTSIYNKKTDERTASWSTGFDHTYSGKGFVDYHYQRFGVHAEYTPENLIGDIKTAVLDYRPDYIIAVDFDCHTDHRGVSMSFESAMGQVLKETSGYEPKVFKCFAYSSAWRAVNDFYAMNIKSVRKPIKVNLNDPTYETDVPQYNWSDRIRLPVYKGSVSHSILRCPDYKALSEHLTQFAFVYSHRIVNGDMVYWNRRTDSLVIDAAVTVSSGDAKLLNDFKLVNTNKTFGEHTKLTGCVSKFSQNDGEKTVTVKFSSPQTVSCVSFYDDFSLKSNILGGVLTFSDGSAVEVPALNTNGSETRVTFAPKSGITSFTFRVTEYEGVPGLCEIEAFEKADYDLGLSLIKLKSAQTDDFMYNYFIEPGENELTLDAYMLDPEAGYTVKIVDGGGVKLDGRKLIFDDSFKKCTVRAELDGDPSTYDQITVTRASETDVKAYAAFVRADNAIFKADATRLKVKNIFVGGHLDEQIKKEVEEAEEYIKDKIK